MEELSVIGKVCATADLVAVCTRYGGADSPGVIAASGQLPSWNPYTYGGTPLLANFDELNVSYVIAAASADRFAGDPAFVRRFQGPAYRVYERRRTRTRAYAIDPVCERRLGAAQLFECRTSAPVILSVTGDSAPDAGSCRECNGGDHRRPVVSRLAR